jgi:hypothetical protein
MPASERMSSALITPGLSSSKLSFARATRLVAIGVCDRDGDLVRRAGEPRDVPGLRGRPIGVVVYRE